jgi:hypothetical protein
VWAETLIDSLPRDAPPSIVELLKRCVDADPDSMLDAPAAHHLFCSRRYICVERPSFNELTGELRLIKSKLKRVMSTPVTSSNSRSRPNHYLQIVGSVGDASSSSDDGSMSLSDDYVSGNDENLAANGITPYNEVVSSSPSPSGSSSAARAKRANGKYETAPVNDDDSQWDVDHTPHTSGLVVAQAEDDNAVDDDDERSSIDSGDSHNNIDAALDDSFASTHLSEESIDGSK